MSEAVRTRGVTSGRDLRSDAKERRDALIAAAATCFAEQGYGVALEEVAARAGVGRGTLYRNFRDRAALALAIFGRELDRVDDIVAEGQDLRQTLLDLARAGGHGALLAARIAPDLVADDANIAEFKALNDRLSTSLEPLAMRAVASGELQHDIDGAQLGLALRMIGGLPDRVLAEDMTDQRLHAAVDLILGGLRPRPGL